MPKDSNAQKGQAARTRDRETVNRTKVLDAALTLFAQRGYHGTSLQDVAKLLHIRTPSLYNHMDSKQALLSTIILDTTEMVWSDFESAVDGERTNSLKLRAAITAYALRHATHPREAIIVNRDVSALEEPVLAEVMALRRKHETAVRQIIIDGCSTKEFDVQTPLLASFGLLEMCVSIARWYREDRGLSAEEIADQYADFSLRLVGARTRRSR